MKVSIIIPFYKNKLWLEEALESVINQSFMDYEIIIINDGSSEKIGDLTNKYNVNIINTVNRGPAMARNTGIELAKGEYVAFLDSDDLWSRDKLEKQITYMEETGYKWSVTWYSTFSIDKGQPDTQIRGCEIPGISIWGLAASCKIATPTVMIKNKILKENKFLRFNTNIRYGEDLCLWLSLAANYPLGVLKETLAKVRLHGDNAAYDYGIQIRARKEIYDYLSRNNIFDISKMPYTLKIAYYLCRKEVEIVDRIKIFSKSNAANIEKVFARIFYLFPWILFKGYRYINERNKDEINIIS